MIEIDHRDITLEIGREGRVEDIRQPAAARHRPPVADVTGARVLASYASNPNPLINASADLMALVAVLRRVEAQPETAYARSTIARSIIELKYRVVRADFPPSVAENLCLLYAIVIDEFVLLSPWGAGSGWENRSLCADLFGFRDGGERFFRITDRALLQPRALKPFLEVVYVFLKLGFTGRFTGQLEHERERLIARIENLGLADDESGADIRPGRAPVATAPLRSGIGLLAKLGLGAALLAAVFGTGWLVRAQTLAESRAEVSEHQARIAARVPVEYVFDSETRETRIGDPE